mgnify:CR=1 FL=1
MSEISTDFENEIIEKITLEGYIKQFDSEIQNIFYNVYGKSLEAIPQNLLQSNLSMDRFLEGLLSLNNVRSQKIILMRLGIVTGSTMTLQEVAEAFGITRERVRQIESMFIGRFRSHARRKRLNEYYNGK